MGKRALAASVVVLLAAGCQPQGDTGGHGRESLQGTWSLVEMVVDGKPVNNPEVRQTYRVTFERDRYSVWIAGRTRWSGVYTVRESGDPKELDITPTDGDDTGKTFLGIYWEDGVVLTVCARVRDRPTRFFGEEERAGLRIVLKRAVP